MQAPEQFPRRSSSEEIIIESADTHISIFDRHEKIDLSIYYKK
jgi:hypothetical protein